MIVDKESTDQTLNQPQTNSNSTVSNNFSISPDNSTNETSKHKTRKSFIVLILFIIFFIALLIGGYYFIKIILPQNPSDKRNDKTVVSNEDKAIQSLTPEQIVNSFFTAVKNKDRATAKTLLSLQVNKGAFESTFEDNPNVPSLYTQYFTFKILDTKISSDGKTAFVNVVLTIDSQSISTLVTLTNDGIKNWLILNTEASLSPGASLPTFAREATRSADLQRVLIVISGPADLYLTSPDGKHEGINPIDGKLVEEIADASYYSNLLIAPGLQQIAVTDLLGSWELKITGKEVGEYVFIAEIVDKDNHQTNTVRGTATKGSVDTYYLRYPAEPGKPVEVIKIK